MLPLLNLVFNDVVLGIGIAVLISMGALLVSDEFKKFRVAKGLFWITAVWIFGRILMWSVFTSESFHTRAIATFLACGVLGLVLTEALRATNAREQTSKEPTEQGTPPKPPDVQQNNQGNNDTNINGNNNTVINGTVVYRTDPEIKARLAEIAKQLKEDNKFSPEKLLVQYPLGYVIFDVDYSDSVFPYHGQALDNWNFDWTKVKIMSSDWKKAHNVMDPSDLFIQMPDVTGKSSGQGQILGTIIAGPKQVGRLSGFYSDSKIQIDVDILAISEKGVVFVIGFSHATPR